MLAAQAGRAVCVRELVGCVSAGELVVDGGEASHADVAPDGWEGLADAATGRSSQLTRGGGHAGAGRREGVERPLLPQEPDVALRRCVSSERYWSCERGPAGVGRGGRREARGVGKGGDVN